MQARANAAAVSRLIEENCGRREWVIPLVVLVGEWRIKDDWRDTDTRLCLRHIAWRITSEISSRY